MEVKSFTKEEQEAIMTNYARLSFSNLKKNIIQDLLSSRNESVIYKKYSKDEIVRMLENPQKNELKIRELSGFLYIISSHYRRLIDYYSTILLYNYSVVPIKIPVEKPKKTEYKKDYYRIINLCDKYNMAQEVSEGIKVAVRDGVFYGICYETEDSFYIKPFLDTRFAKISSVEDGVYRFSLDLSYFSGKESLLDAYGEDFRKAYDLFKGNKDKGIVADKSKRWYEVPNGIVLKADKADPFHSLPVFTGLFLDIFSIDDFKLLQKAKAEADNYKVLSAKIETDDDGFPKMDYPLAEKYYGQMAGNLPSGIGLLLSPFNIDEFSFQTSATADRNNVTESINTFWQGAGSPSSLFGGGDISSSGAMSIAVKPDEALAFSILSQFERFINMRFKKLDLKYPFKLKFSRLSIFNQDEYNNRLSKAASLGLPVKLEYASALGLSPSEALGLTYLEEDVLGLSKKVWLNVPVSSNTVSGDAGRPSNADNGEQLTESGEQTKENESNTKR